MKPDKKTRLEKAGFRVSPQFKEDLKRAMAGGPR